MKRRYLSGHAKRKQKEARLENEAKGRRTLDQLNWITVENTTANVEEETVNTSVLEESPCESGTLPTGEEMQVSGQDFVGTDEFTSPAEAVNEATRAISLQVDQTQQPSITSPSSPPQSSAVPRAPVSNDVATWKKLSPNDIDVISVMGPQAIPKNLPKDSKQRSFPMSIFAKQLPNGETVRRDWLVWSQTTSSLYCFPCCLFDTNKALSSASSEFSRPELGCKDNWRKLYEKTQMHERSAVHISNYIKWRDLVISLEKKRGVDNLRQEMIATEQQRWRKILRCLLEVTLFLAERNLPFRGTSSNVGDLDNGLFLGTLELISSYNPTIKEHLDTVMKHQKRGERMQAHYLSWQSQNEFLSICAKKVLDEVCKEINRAYYYGLIVDGTPDVSHTEQLTFVIRYAVLQNNTWVLFERFLTLRDFEKKKGEDICEIILSTLNDHKIDVARCRGQGYDNGSNMSGCYNGVQALILQKNPQAFYAPCSAHTLNLCGVHSVEVAPEIKLFFGNVQKLYTLFSSSPARWKILKETVGVSLHSLSQTRWSARIDAIKPLVKNHNKMLEALSKLQTDLDLNAEAYSDVESLSAWMKSFEYVLLASVWFKTLQCIDDVNKLLQHVDISIAEEAKCLDGLREDIRKLRNSWECVLEEAKLTATALGQPTSFKERRGRKRTTRDPYETSGHVNLNQENLFKVDVFYQALDNLFLQLTERFTAIEKIAKLFGFIVNPPPNPDPESVVQQAERLAMAYPNDIIKEDLKEELRHYSKFCNNFDEGIGRKRNKALALLNYIFEKRIESLYPQICICLRIFLAIPVSVASGERSFSKLALIKNRLRSTMSQERVANLMVLSIEHRLARSLDYEELINSFAAEKARKKNC